MLRFYKKEIPSNPLYLPNGKRVPFRTTHSNVGIFATDKEGIIAELDRMSQKRVGGVIQIDQTEFQNIRDGGKPGTHPSVNKSFMGDGNGETPGIDQLYIKWRIARGRMAFIPIPAPKLPTGRIIHVLERHKQKNKSSERRVMAAFNSWVGLYEQGVIPCHVWDYPRSGRSIGDTRDLPYLKDILQAGLNVSQPGDLIMFSNDDTILHESTPKIIQQMIRGKDALSSFRLNFNEGKVPAPNANLKRICNQGGQCLGRDLFVFRREWLQLNFNSIPDFILGELEWDLVLSVIVRRTAGVMTTKKNFTEIIPKCDLPRGYVIHENHERNWVDARFSNSPAKIHNNLLACEWYCDNGFEALIGKLL